MTRVTFSPSLRLLLFSVGLDNFAVRLSEANIMTTIVSVTANERLILSKTASDWELQTGVFEWNRLSQNNA
jgi:hypothetical protein